MARRDEVAPLDQVAGLTAFIEWCDQAKADAAARRRVLLLELAEARTTRPVMAARCGVSEKTIGKELAQAREERSTR